MSWSPYQADQIWDPRASCSHGWRHAAKPRAEPLPRDPTVTIHCSRGHSCRGGGGQVRRKGGTESSRPRKPLPSAVSLQRLLSTSLTSCSLQRRNAEGGSPLEHKWCWGGLRLSVSIQWSGTHVSRIHSFFTAVQYSFVWIVYIFFIYLPIDGHLCCFQAQECYKQNYHTHFYLLFFEGSFCTQKSC